MFQQLWYSILFSRKARLTDAGPEGEKKNPLCSHFTRRTTNQSRLLVLFHSWSRDTRPRLRKRALSFWVFFYFLTPVISFSSCSETARLLTEFAYVCPLGQSRTRSVSLRPSAPGYQRLSGVYTPRQYVSDHRKTCLFGADGKIN